MIAIGKLLLDYKKDYARPQLDKASLGKFFQTFTTNLIILV